jgi:spore germination cell wall hydrolase CwlJ-like protein
MMNRWKKLLITLIMTTLICTSFSNIAFAADQTDTTDTGTNATDASVFGPDGQLLGDGYFVDEQGQLYFDESLIEPEDTETDEAAVTDETDVDTDNTVEDTEDTQITDAEDTEDSKDTKTEKADSKADNKKTSTAKEEKATYTKAELRLLSCLIYAEAGNQTYSAMLGVANVVLNRVKSDVYWHVNTIKEVIYDRKWSVQFAVTIKNSKGVSPLDKALKAYDSGKFSGGNPEAEKKAMNKAIKAAKAALTGENNIGSYLCFSNKGYKSYVKKHYSKYEIIDDLIFFRAQ